MRGETRCPDRVEVTCSKDALFVQTIRQTRWFLVRFGDMEARLGTRRIEQEKKRDENVAEMKGYIEARQAQINAAVQAKVDEI